MAQKFVTVEMPYHGEQWPPSRWWMVRAHLYNVAYTLLCVWPPASSKMEEVTPPTEALKRVK